MGLGNEEGDKGAVSTYTPPKEGTTSIFTAIVI